jgi:hypothetical protein
VAQVSFRFANFKNKVFADLIYDDITNTLLSVQVTNNSTGIFTVTLSGGPLLVPISVLWNPGEVKSQILPVGILWTVDAITGDLSFPFQVACNLVGDS